MPRSQQLLWTFYKGFWSLYGRRSLIRLSALWTFC
jgi:hypothetical protein